MGKGLKNLFKKLGDAGKKALNTLKNAGEKALNTVKEAAIFTAFIPLMPLAILYLKRRGITGLKKPSDVVKAVYQEMKKKSYGMEGPADLFDYSFEDFGYSLEEFGLTKAEDYGFAVTPEMVTAVIQFLKGIFDSIKKKKESGEKLSPDEQAIAEQAQDIDAKLSEAKAAAQEMLAAENKSTPASNTTRYILIGVAVLVLILLAIFLFKRK